MLHPVRGTRSPPPVEVGDIGHRVIEIAGYDKSLYDNLRKYHTGLISCCVNIYFAMACCSASCSSAVIA